jgi:predicted O-methyltransferase YrrM
MKNLLYKLIRTAELDKKSVNSRLGDIKSRHAEISAVFAPSRSVIPPTQRLFDIFSKLILEAPRQSDALFRQRKNVPDYVFDFPGEHYKVLQALTTIISARNIIEIGTFTGLSSLGFFHVMNKDHSLHSFDIVPWNNFAETVLLEEDFERFNYKQVLSDLGHLENTLKYNEILKKADLIFCDGPKDGHFEKNLILNFEKVGLKDGCILFFDDIKQWNMLKIWYDIKMPKLDITSIGHFTGSGIIEWDRNYSCF